MNKLSIPCVALAVLAGLAVFASAPACRSSAGGGASRAEQQKQEQAEMMAAIPADSPLAKLQPGMSEGEVGSILGTPTSQDAHTTGKQFIPFNFAAKDTMRTVYYYKGIGRVEFSSGSWGQRNGIVKIVADAAEPGFRRAK